MDLFGRDLQRIEEVLDIIWDECYYGIWDVSGKYLEDN